MLPGGASAASGRPAPRRNTAHTDPGPPSAARRSCRRRSLSGPGELARPVASPEGRAGSSLLATGSCASVLRLRGSADPRTGWSRHRQTRYRQQRRLAAGRWRSSSPTAVSGATRGCHDKLAVADRVGGHCVCAASMRTGVFRGRLPPPPGGAARPADPGPSCGPDVPHWRPGPGELCAAIAGQAHHHYQAAAGTPMHAGLHACRDARLGSEREEPAAATPELGRDITDIMR